MQGLVIKNRYEVQYNNMTYKQNTRNSQDKNWDFCMAPIQSIQVLIHVAEGANQISLLPVRPIGNSWRPPTGWEDTKWTEFNWEEPRYAHSSIKMTDVFGRCRQLPVLIPPSLTLKDIDWSSQITLPVSRSGWLRTNWLGRKMSKASID